MIVNDYFVKTTKEPKAKWCKRCGRKHPARKPCNLEKVKDLTVHREGPEEGMHFEGRSVGHYRVRKDETNRDKWV